VAGAVVLGAAVVGAAEVAGAEVGAGCEAQPPIMKLRVTRMATQRIRDFLMFTPPNRYYLNSFLIKRCSVLMGVP
jgi:hypothetical protein